MTAFDGDSAKVYAKLAEQHRHPNGPWKIMLNKIKTFHDLPENAKIVDVASGQGEPAITIATNFPTTMTVFSTDVSVEMHKAAAKQAINIPNLKAMIADAQDLSSFESNSIDVVTCCYGFMFPEDKGKALGETYRILKPNGKLIATYWINLDVLNITRDIMSRILGKDPPLPPQNPMSLSEPGLFASLARTAGFNTDDLDSVESKYPFDIGTDEEFQYKISTLLIKSKLDELNAHEMAREVFKEIIGNYTILDSSGALIFPNNVFTMVTLVK